MSNGRKFLLIEFCDFEGFPIGGYLSFAKQMASAYKGEISLVGLSTDESPVGCWCRKKIKGIEYDFFAVAKVSPSDNKPLVPRRLQAYLSYRRYRKDIFARNFERVFVQTPEALLALPKKYTKIVIARVPGLENPLSISRYWYAGFFAKYFGKIYFRALAKANVILATADSGAISSFISQSNGVLSKDKVIQFPSRIDTGIFRQRDKIECRLKKDISLDSFVLVTSGRISALKGWRLLVDSFAILKKSRPNSMLVFVGDGEDLDDLQGYIISKRLKDSVLLAGRVNHDALSVYLNAGDVFVMGSFVEGWSTSLMEAIACGLPAVVTQFSSAKDLVEHGVTGFVCETRDPIDFAFYLNQIDCLSLKDLEELSGSVKGYSVNGLKNAIENILCKVVV